MAENLHFRDLLQSFERFGVEYLITAQLMGAPTSASERPRKQLHYADKNAFLTASVRSG